MVKLLKSDILLVCTWLFLLGLVIYFGPIKGLEPPTVPLVLLVIIALIPLAERLKIGNWFDFTRKVENLSKEVSSTQEEVRGLHSLLSASMMNIQGQQQFNISLPSEKAVRAFTESMSRMQYPNGSMKVIDSVGEDAFFSGKVSPTDRRRFTLMNVAQLAIASARPVVMMLYDATLTKQEHKIRDLPPSSDKDLVSIIEELQRDWGNTFGTSKDSTTKIQEHLESIKTLFRLYEDLDKKNIEPTPIEEWSKLIAAANEAAGYLAGYTSAILSTVYLHLQILQSGERSSES